MITDYLFVGEALVERLRDQVADLREVYTRYELANLPIENQQYPSAEVFYAGESIDETEGGRARANVSQRVTQRWYVVVVSDNQRQGIGTARNDEAGPILASVHRALAGYQVTGLREPLRRASAPGPTYSANNARHVLAFAATFIIN